jgi:hemolysin D
VIKAERKAKLQILTVPMDGVVHRLVVHTIGGVVTPAQPLAVVVPHDSELEIEAMVSDRDIGFVCLRLAGRGDQDRNVQFHAL